MTMLLYDDHRVDHGLDIAWRERGIAAALQVHARMGPNGDAVLRAIRRHRPGLATLTAGGTLERPQLLRFLAALPGGTRPLLAGEAALQDGAGTVPHFAWLAATWEGRAIEIVLLPGGTRGGTLYCGPDAAGLLRLARAIDDHAVRPLGRALRYAGGWRPAPDLDAALGAVTWDDLVLPPATLAGLRQAVESFAASRATFRSLGFPWRRGILLVGPPGTGKTLACKAAAAALPDYPFLYVRDLRDDRGHDVLQAVFARARRRAPCILAFEDLDGLVGPWNRAIFLNELDGFSRNDGLLVIASSNHPEQIDPALLKRPARFDRVFHLGLPGTDERRAFCALVLGRLAAAGQLAPDLALAPLAARVAAATAGFTPAYLQEAFTGAALRAVYDGGTTRDARFADTVLAHVGELREALHVAHDPAALAAVDGRDGGAIGFRS